MIIGMMDLLLEGLESELKRQPPAPSKDLDREKQQCLSSGASEEVCIERLYIWGIHV